MPMDAYLKGSIGRVYTTWFETKDTRVWSSTATIQPAQRRSRPCTGTSDMCVRNAADNVNLAKAKEDKLLESAAHHDF